MGNEAEALAVSQAIDTIKTVREDLKSHILKFDAHVKDQHEFNREITERVVIAEKADLTINGKLDLTIEQNRLILKAFEESKKQAEDAKKEEQARHNSLWDRFGKVTPYILAISGWLYAYFF